MADLTAIALAVLALSLTIILSVPIILFMLSMLWTNITTLVPWVKTPDRNIVCILARLGLKEGAVLYDPGCGDGRVLFRAEKIGLKTVGFELSPYPFLKARLTKWVRHSSAEIYRKDFFEEDLGPADAVYIFLVSHVMGRLANKLKKELKPGARIASYAFELPGFDPIDIIDTVPSRTYIYEI